MTNNQPNTPDRIEHEAEDLTARIAELMRVAVEQRDTILKNLELMEAQAKSRRSNGGLDAEENQE